MYKSLQAGRAAAAVLVLLYHVGCTFADQKYFASTWLFTTFSFGRAGVEFFFVLSGFIIFHAHYQDISRPTACGKYLLRRSIRIYPTYWIVFVLVYLSALPFESLRDKLPAHFMDIAKCLLLLPQDPHSNAWGTGAPVLVVAWTLHYELVFYALFFTSIIHKSLGLILGCVFAAALLAMPNASFPFSFMSLQLFTLFVIGMASSCYCIYHPLNASRSRSFFIAGSLLFLLFSLNTVTGLQYFENYSSILYGVSCGLIVVGLVGMERNGTVVGQGAFVQLLGNSSYSLYLIHVPLLGAMCKVFMKCGLAGIGAIGLVLLAVCSFIACISVAIAFHLVVERKTLEYLHGITLKTKWRIRRIE